MIKKPSKIALSIIALASLLPAVEPPDVPAADTSARFGTEASPSDSAQTREDSAAYRGSYLAPRSPYSTIASAPLPSSGDPLHVWVRYRNLALQMKSSDGEQTHTFPWNWTRHENAFAWRKIGSYSRSDLGDNIVLINDPKFNDTSGLDALVITADTDWIPEARVRKDIDYLGEGRTEKLDLYLPVEPPPESGYPAAVLIHGGGFGGGSKNSRGNIANSLRLAQSGIVVANIDYLLATRQQRSWPVALHDCKNAIRFLRTHAKRYHIDPDRISVIGFSAGGQLALLTGLTFNDPELTPETPYPGVSDQVHAVISLFGGTNFVTRRVVGPDGEPTDEPYYATARGLLGSHYPDRNPELWAQASPVTHAHQDAPPVLIIHGKRDSAVDYHQALELATALEQAGAPHKLILDPDLGHGFRNRPIPDDFYAEILKFIKQ